MDYTYGMDAMAAQNTQQDNFFNQSGNEQGSEIETQGTNFDREVPKPQNPKEMKNKTLQNPKIMKICKKYILYFIHQFIKW